MISRMAESFIWALAAVGGAVLFIVCIIILIGAWSDCDRRGGALVKSLGGYSCVAEAKR
jgi:hypothetical protein